MFLDQVNAHAEATIRFSIPSDSETLLQLAHEYRTPENLLCTALMPAFKETLQANAIFDGCGRILCGWSNRV